MLSRAHLFALAAALTVLAAPALADTSCSDAQELETGFDLSIVRPGANRPTRMHFTYVSCDWAPRNDYLPPYTERNYKGPDGYGLTIVTDDGRESSDVLLSKGKDWVGRFGYKNNDKLVSGESIAAGDVEENGVKSSASLRATEGVFPQTKVCDIDVKAISGRSPRDAQGRVGTGFSYGPSLVLLTDTQAVYYHETCDICAELYVCELKTGAARTTLWGHSAGCSDLQPYRKERGVVYDACDGGN